MYNIQPQGDYSHANLKNNFSMTFKDKLYPLLLLKLNSILLLLNWSWVKTKTKTCFHGEFCDIICKMLAVWTEETIISCP